MNKTALFASVALRSFMSDIVETVIVNMGGTPVRVNKSDYEADKDSFTLHEELTAEQVPAIAGTPVGLPDNIIVPPAPSAPNFGSAPGEPVVPAGAPVPPTSPSPGAKLIMKNTKGKFIVVEGTEPYAPIKGVEGIDEKGYATQEDAAKAIAGLPQDNLPA